MRRYLQFPSAFVKKAPLVKKQIDFGISVRGLTSEQNMSAKKKCLNLTSPNGEIRILPIVFTNSHLSLHQMILKGMSGKKKKNKKLNRAKMPIWFQVFSVNLTKIS